MSARNTELSTKGVNKMAEKTYKNICNAPVLGNPPGKVFKADIPDAQLKRMIARHSIEEVDSSAVTDPPEESVDSEKSDEEGNKDGDQQKPEVQTQGQTPAPKTPPVQKRS
jgi:hypothetical protein